MKQTLQLDNSDSSIPLPRPGDQTVTHEPRAELIHEVNPAYLSYWDPDALGRAFYFWTSALVLISSSVFVCTLFLTVLKRGYLVEGRSPDAIDIGATIFFGLLPVLSAIFTCLSVRRPLRPATYVNRNLRRVYAWHGNKKIDGGWTYIDWDKVVPVTRRTRLYHTSGSSTLYTLQLLEIDLRSKAILKTINVFTPQRAPEMCGEVWEYIRRYMQCEPGSLLPARIDWRMKGFWGLVIRLYESAFELWMKRDGSLRLFLYDYLILPPMVAVTYAFVGISVWLEHIVPKQKVPAELKQANFWTGQNPYPIYESSPEEQAKLKQKAKKILPFNLLLMSVSILLQLAVLGILTYAAWF